MAWRHLHPRRWVTGPRRPIREPATLRSRMKPISRDALVRAARVYKSNKDASQAIGIHPRSFARLCREHGILTPWKRHRQQRQAARS